MKPLKGENVICGGCGKEISGKANAIKQNHDGTLWVRCGRCVGNWHRQMKGVTHQMKALTGEKLSRMIGECRVKCNALGTSDPTKLTELDKAMAVDFEEHFKFQQMQAEFHVGGLLEPEAAQIIYIALGEVGSVKNGGWAADTDTAQKVIVTQLMGELLTIKLSRALKHKARV